MKSLTWSTLHISLGIQADSLKLMCLNKFYSWNHIPVLQNSWLYLYLLFTKVFSEISDEFWLPKFYLFQELFIVLCKIYYEIIQILFTLETNVTGRTWFILLADMNFGYTLISCESLTGLNYSRTKINCGYGDKCVVLAFTSSIDLGEQLLFTGFYFFFHDRFRELPDQSIWDGAEFHVQRRSGLTWLDINM